MTKAESIAYLRRLQKLEKLATEKELAAPTLVCEEAFRELETTEKPPEFIDNGTLTLGDKTYKCVS
jgi:hypothetical protein